MLQEGLKYNTIFDLGVGKLECKAILKKMIFWVNLQN